MLPTRNHIEPYFVGKLCFALLGLMFYVFYVLGRGLGVQHEGSSVD
jgi:hypothetical protein